MSYILFGGLFDPPHKGHMEIAAAALKEINPEVIYWIPSRFPPHRQQGILSGDKRFEILKRWLSSVERMQVSDIELKPEHSGYTVETVEIFKKEKADNDCYLLIGSDEAENFTLWKDWKKILDMVSLLVGRRREKINIPSEVNARVLDNKIVEISSTTLREKLANGENTEGELSPEVIKIIDENGFYRI